MLRNPLITSYLKVTHFSKETQFGEISKSLGSITAGKRTFNGVSMPFAADTLFSTSQVRSGRLRRVGTITHAITAEIAYHVWIMGEP